MKYFVNREYTFLTIHYRTKTCQLPFLIQNTHLKDIHMLLLILPVLSPEKQRNLLKLLFSHFFVVPQKVS